MNEPRIENTACLEDETGSAAGFMYTGCMFRFPSFQHSMSMRNFVQSAGMSYKPNFRKCNSTAQRSNGKGSKWLTRVDDQGGYEAPLRMAMADNAALQRKGVKGGKSEGKEQGKGKGLGKRSKGKGARLPLTDLVPEPDPEQKFIMVRSSEKTRIRIVFEFAY